MSKKIVVKDRVRVREDSLYAVSSYQSKPLGFRRLVGVVLRATPDRLFVDFCQRDIPRRPDGSMFGERTRVSALYRRQNNYKGHGFPRAIFERAGR